MTGTQLFLDVVARVKPWLDEQGYEKLEASSRFRVFSKNANDLTFFVAFSKLPPARFPECEATIYPELLVSVPELNEKLGIELTNWTFGPIRISLRRLDTFPRFDPESSEVWCVNTPQEAEAAASEILELLESRGSEVFGRYLSPSDVANDSRVGGQHVFRGGTKGVYDADVIDGLIDPKVTPYVPGK